MLQCFCSASVQYAHTRGRKRVLYAAILLLLLLLRPPLHVPPLTTTVYAFTHVASHPPLFNTTYALRGSNLGHLASSAVGRWSGRCCCPPFSRNVFCPYMCTHTYRTVTSRIPYRILSSGAPCVLQPRLLSMCAVCVSRVDVDAKSLDDASKFQQASCESLRFATTAIMTASYSTCNMQGCWISPSGTGPSSRRAACIAALSMAAHAPCYLPDRYPLCQQAGHHRHSRAAPGWVRTSARPQFAAFRRIAVKTLRPANQRLPTCTLDSGKFERVTSGRLFDPERWRFKRGYRLPLAS
ncbi:hypothetical protein C8Q70DRAFT_55979 [Cubamyces menziesii]|nr:hypothetical protein C8Q70DRAFT_55979 [Cubamyces menziesii]